MGERDWNRSAREDAPSAREYRDLLRTAKALDEESDKYDLRHTFLVRTMGELGLRAGEVTHMRKTWVDLDRGRIEIPSHDPCDKGRDGGPCGYCKSQAHQAVDYPSNDLTVEEELETRWKPKLESSARIVPYSFDDSLVELYDQFFQKYDQYPWCRSAMNRWVNNLAEESEEIEKKDDIYPHAFRGHAARRFAREGMRAHPLRRLMGWGTVDSAMDYIRMEANDLEKELFKAFGEAF